MLLHLLGTGNLFRDGVLLRHATTFSNPLLVFFTQFNLVLVAPADVVSVLQQTVLLDVVPPPATISDF